MAVKHKFTNPEADAPPAKGPFVRPSDWNDDHLFDAEAANKVLVGPASGGAAVPNFRALALADLPSIVTHDKYTDAEAIAAVPFVGYIPFGSEPISDQFYSP